MLLRKINKMKTGLKYFLTGMVLGLPLAGTILNSGCEKKNDSGLEDKVGQGVVARRLAEQGREYSNVQKGNEGNVADRFVQERLQKNVAENYVGKSVQESVEKENYIELVQNQNYPTDISENGVKLISEFEGFRATPYDDFGQMAIGYGHRIEDGENLTNITREQAEQLLYGDVNYVKESISENVEVSLNQNQYDALCSFTYNVGVGNFEDSTLLRKLNNGDYNGAANEFQRWNKADGEVLKGLIKRRTAEAELFREN